MIDGNVIIQTEPKNKIPVEPIDYVFRFAIGALFGVIIGWLPPYRIYPIEFGTIERVATYALVSGALVVILEEYFWRVLLFLTRFLTRGQGR